MGRGEILLATLPQATGQTMTVLRLILGDQLNRRHSWFAETRADVVYVFMEVRQETDYVLHHAQKILAIFSAMRQFAEELNQAGHRVDYCRIGDADNRHSFPANLDKLIARYQATGLHWQQADEWRLDRQLHEYATSLPIPATAVDTEHFHTARDEAGRLFQGKSRWLMEHFYRAMRIKHGVLLDGQGKPVGGQWNYDVENRKAWPGTPPPPPDRRPTHDCRALWDEIQAAGVRSFGNPQAETLRWPVSREEALAQLNDFIEYSLPCFGLFQDAISTQEPRLFHSLLSFALNVKLLSPQEVVAAAESAYFAGQAPLAAVEGFIRQILGWREYVRGVYWAKMPGYAMSNYFQAERPLPAWYWTGKTQMRCLAHAIGQSLDMAYAHHIQRLMLTGNFALLAGLSPHALHEWYLGIYIDAFEWVELPNTLGMSQFADGGFMATKPYVSTAAYINRMGDSCRGCRYDRKARVGERACPFNALYWDFYRRHASLLEKNPRIGMAYRQLAKMTGAELTGIQTQAEFWLGRLDEL